MNEPQAAGGSHDTSMQDDSERPRQVICWILQKEPRTFSVKADVDVDDWLKYYQWVSGHNGWNSTARLANVVFFLTGTALLWLDNNESTMTTWERFVEEIKCCFGDSLSKRKKAEHTLARRAQLPGETCTTYIEEVLKLWRIVNTGMSDEDKVGHFLKGIAEDVNNFLISKEDLRTPSDLRRHCRAFEALETRRVLPKFGRFDNVTTVASVDISTSHDIALLVRQLIIEELAHFQAQGGGRDTPREYQQSTLDERCPTQPVLCQLQIDSENWPLRDENVRVDPVEFRHPSPNFERRQAAPPQRLSPRYSQPQILFYDNPVYREPPIRFSCGIRGHIARYCRRRQQQVSAFSDYQSGGRYRAPWRTAVPLRRHPREHVSRRESPASDRSLTPPPTGFRRSPSPRRRSLSPPSELGN